MCNITCTYTRFFDETLRANVKQSTLALTIPLKIYSNEISKWTFMLFVKITKAPYKAYGNKEKHRKYVNAYWKDEWQDGRNNNQRT